MAYIIDTTGGGISETRARDLLSAYQDKLEDNVNIKTINNQSILIKSENDDTNISIPS